MAQLIFHHYPTLVVLTLGTANTGSQIPKRPLGLPSTDAPNSTRVRRVCGVLSDFTIVTRCDTGAIDQYILSLLCRIKLYILFSLKLVVEIVSLMNRSTKSIPTRRVRRQRSLAESIYIKLTHRADRVTIL